jgi:drug/metabolite transporter (DMT)-like permease
LFTIFFFNETASVLKYIGVVLAVCAVVFISMNGDKKAKGLSVIQLVLTLVLFFGSGFLDSLLKYVDKTQLTDADKNPFLISGFLTAGVFGLIALIYLYFTKNFSKHFNYKCILAGICIGIPNYFSIWCLLKVLGIYANAGSTIIPINNMGIVVFSSLVALLFFNEKLSKIQWGGLALAIISISLILIG